jgi:ComF family protein
MIYCNNCPMLPGLDRISALGIYYPIGRALKVKRRNLISEHIRSLKRCIDYAEPLGQAMALSVQHKYGDLKKSNAIVPVPQHRDKYSERPYNQAEELAKVVSSRLGIPIANVMSKTKNMSETGEDVHERFEMANEMYAYTGSPMSLQGKNVLLIDDVVTFGATAAACSKILKDNGASTVEVLVAGRAYRPPRGVRERLIRALARAAGVKPS